MARVKPDEVVYALDREFRKALSDTMTHFAPGVKYNESDLFSYFSKAVYRHCGSWETVPDSCVEM
jgi:hypothetical protein